MWLAAKTFIMSNLKGLGIGIALVIVAYMLQSFYGDIKSAFNDNKRLREQVSELEETNRNLKLNIEVQKISCEDKIKALEFKNKTEKKAQEVQTKIDTYKVNDETKSIKNEGVKRDEKNNTTTNTPIYFNL